MSKSVQKTDQELKHGFTADQIREYKDVFAMIDKDGDNSITTAELGAMFSTMGVSLSRGELYDMISQVDLNGNGRIEFDEFLAMLAVERNQQTTELKELFDFFDKDGSGTISADEFTSVLQALGEEDFSEEEIKVMVSDADKNGDGEIDFEEFRQSLQTSVMGTPRSRSEKASSAQGSNSSSSTSSSSKPVQRLPLQPFKGLTLSPILSGRRLSDTEQKNTYVRSKLRSQK